ncbi:MAG: diguanylate cyclase [Laribacter sp.]|nr:diguanylate cyclase [Laribacter sp.]MBP9527173.1 diguanylate cyclase [Laribacter sp.]
MNDIHNQSDTKDNANFAIVTLILFPAFLLIGFYFFFYQTQSYLTSVTEKYAKEVSEKNKGGVDRSIDDILTRIKTIALVIDNSKGLQPLDPVLSKMEERGLKDEFQALRVLVIDKHGNASTGDNLKSDFSHREYFRIAMTGITNVSQHIYDIWSKKSIHVFASPIIFNGNVSGVAALTITRETLNKILQKSSTEGESSFYVVQNDGYVISQPTHQDQQWTGSNIVDIFKKAGIKDDDLKSIMDKNGLKDLTGKTYKFSLTEKSIYISISKSKHNDWYIISISPDSFVPTWYKYFLHVAFAVLIIGCLFFILIIAIFKLKKEHDNKIHRILFDDPITEAGTTNSLRAKYNSLIKEKNQEKLIFIAFDIIGFKVLNLYAGRDVCDKFLKFIAHNTYDIFDKNCLIARTSADNFIIATRNNSLENILVKIDLLSNKIHENKLTPGAKIAFGIYEAKDHDLIDDCIDRANLAKTTSKLQQKNGATVCFDDRMIQKKLKQQNVEASMHAALLNREFKLYLQPKVRLSDNKIIGAEALVR